jgi:hypothetical protein
MSILIFIQYSLGVIDGSVQRGRRLALLALSGHLEHLLAAPASGKYI